MYSEPWGDLFDAKDDDDDRENDNADNDDFLHNESMLSDTQASDVASIAVPRCSVSVSDRTSHP